MASTGISVEITRHRWSDNVRSKIEAKLNMGSISLKSESTGLIATIPFNEDFEDTEESTAEKFFRCLSDAGYFKIYPFETTEISIPAALEYLVPWHFIVQDQLNPEIDLSELLDKSLYKEYSSKSYEWEITKVQGNPAWHVQVNETPWAVVRTIDALAFDLVPVPEDGAEFFDSVYFRYVVEHTLASSYLQMLEFSIGRVRGNLCVRISETYKGNSQTFHEFDYLEEDYLNSFGSYIATPIAESYSDWANHVRYAPAADSKGIFLANLFEAIQKNEIVRQTSYSQVDKAVSNIVETWIFSGLEDENFNPLFLYWLVRQILVCDMQISDAEEQVEKLVLFDGEIPCGEVRRTNLFGNIFSDWKVEFDQDWASSKSDDSYYENSEDKTGRHLYETQIFWQGLQYKIKALSSFTDESELLLAQSLYMMKYQDAFEDPDSVISFDNYKGGA